MYITFNAEYAQLTDDKLLYCRLFCQDKLEMVEVKVKVRIVVGGSADKKQFDWLNITT